MQAQTVDPRRCPLCGQPNRCANEVARATGQAQPPCWCTTVHFTPRLLARVPAPAQRQACICEACARAAQSQAVAGGLTLPPR